MILEKSRSAHEEGERQEYRLVSPEKIAETLRFMRNSMATEAASLEQRGFPVGSDGRIVPEKTGLTTVGEQQKHRKLVAAREAEWRAKETRPLAERKQSENTGELLELVKTLSINQLWFGKRLVSVRTSQYDDYEHGVDNFIFDTETGEPIVAIDEATAGGMAKKSITAKRDKVENGATITYGFAVDKETNRVSPKSYANLPVFLISVTTEDLLALARDLMNQEMSQYNIVQSIIDSLINQAYDAAYGDPEDVQIDRTPRNAHRTTQRLNLPVINKSLREAYGRALKIFEAL